MWTPRAEITNAIAALKLQLSQFRELPPEDTAPIQSRVKSHFLTASNPLFWWEHFRLPCQTWAANVDQSYKLLPQVVPDANEIIWFIPHDDPIEPVYETSTGTAVMVLGECAAFEYSLVGKQLDWLVLENHHDCLFAVGESAIANLDRLAKRTDI